MHASLLGNTKAGKSTVGAALAFLIWLIRRGDVQPGRKRRSSAVAIPTPPEGIAGGRPFHGIATERTSGAVLASWGMTVSHRRALKGVKASVIAAAGGVVQLDTATAPYEFALASFRDQSNSYRKETGLQPVAQMRPETWSIINREYRRSITEAAELNRVDLVEIHRNGVGFVLHPDYGLVTTEGLHPRGQAESGSPSDMLFYVDGGLKTKSRPSWERWLTVVSDPTEQLVGVSFPLPELRTPADRTELVRLLWTKLGAGLEAVISKTDVEREAWVSLLTAEEPDEWGEAQEGAERAESARLIETIKLSLMQQGVDGQGSDAKAARAEALLATFGVSSVDLLEQVPVAQLRNVKALREYLTTAHAARLRSATLAGEIRLVLAKRALLGSKKETAKQTLSYVLVNTFGVESVDSLPSVAVETLEEGAKLLPDVLQGMGWVEVEGAP